MTYSSLMVYWQLGASNASLVKFTADVAGRFGAGLIGFSVRRPTEIIYTDGPIPGDMIEQDRVDIDEEIKAAEIAFRDAFKGKVAQLDWRCAGYLGSFAETIARQTRAADLVITNSLDSSSSIGASRRLDVGDLVMRAGRPVLIVPQGAEKLDLENVVVGWKDTRETRRAIFDALPLLKRAGRVTVLETVEKQEIPDARDRLKDVAAWLDRHGIAAEPIAVAGNGNDVTALDAAFLDLGTTLVVAGAYGHSRLREWAFGGVTRNTLLHAQRPTFVSH